jgi:pilus assembly protein CpaE
LTSAAPRILVLDRSGELAVRLRHNVVAAGAVVKACPDTGQADRLLAAGEWDVVVAGPTLMHRTGLRRLASLHARHPGVAVLLALHERPRADLTEIVRVGASDLVPLHAADNELHRALLRSARITRKRRGILAAGPGGAGLGRVLMVASASGGCGKTFLATNAAAYLTRTTDQPVVLFDLDLQFGEVSTALRLRPAHTIIDALTAEAEGEELDEVLGDCLLAHPDGFKVLAAPRHPEEADSVTPGDVTRILDVLRARGAWVVIDTHEGLSDLFRAALDAADHVLAVATPDRPSLVNLERYLGMLERLGVARSNVSVVLNKAEGGRGFESEHLALPYSREVARSINVGVPILVGKPKSNVSALLNSVLSDVVSRAPKPRPQPARNVPDEPVIVGEPIEAEVDLRLLLPIVEIDLTGDGPVRIDPAQSAETPFCRGRSPPVTRYGPTRPQQLVPP